MLILLNRAIKRSTLREFTLIAHFSSTRALKNGDSSFRSRVLSVRSKEKRGNSYANGYRRGQNVKMDSERGSNHGYERTNGNAEGRRRIYRDGDIREYKRRNGGNFETFQDVKSGTKPFMIGLEPRKSLDNNGSLTDEVENNDVGKVGGKLKLTRKMYKTAKCFRDKHEYKLMKKRNEDAKERMNWSAKKEQRNQSIKYIMAKFSDARFGFRFPDQGLAKGSQCKWKEIGYYSMATRLVMAFDRSRLKPLRIPTRYYDEENERPFYDLYTGMKSFKMMNFNDRIPPSMPGLCAMMHSERFSAQRKLDEYQIVGQLSLFEDLLLERSAICVDLVKLDGQIFACNGYNGEMPLRYVYTASKFRKILTNRKRLPEHVRPKKGYHVFQTLTEISFPGSHVKALVDYPVDVCDEKGASENLAGQYSKDDVYSTYVETMLYKVPRYVEDEMDKTQTLDFLRENSKDFLKKLFRDLFRLKLRNIPQIVIGVRDERYKLIVVHKYTVSFLEDYFRKWGAPWYMKTLETAESRLGFLLKWICEKVEDENVVYKLHYDEKAEEIKLAKMTQQYVRYNESFKRVLIKQLVDWRKYNKFPTGLNKSFYQMRDVDLFAKSKISTTKKIERRRRKNAANLLDKKQRKLDHWIYHFRIQSKDYKRENEKLPAIRYEFDHLPKVQ